MAAVQEKQIVSAFDLFGKSFEAVKRNINTFSVLWLLPLMSMLGSTLWERSNRSEQDQWASLGGLFNFAGLPRSAVVSMVSFGIILFIIMFVLTLFIQAMTYALQLEAANGKTPGFDFLWQQAKKYWFRLFGLSLVVGVLMILGFLLLIVPGLIVLRRYFLAPYILIDKDLSISQAMEESAKLTKPNSRAIWGVIGVSILLALPSIIPVVGPIIAFLLGAAYSVAPALRYEELKKLV